MAEPDPYADAERLMRAAQRAADAAAAAGDQVPPRGWAVPGDGDGAAHGGSPAFPDLSGLVALVEALRGTVPPDLWQQLSDAVRELLVALRAVLDFSIARLDRPAQEPVQVEEIPIE
jgi:hypothetical protein